MHITNKTIPLYSRLASIVLRFSSATSYFWFTPFRPVYSPPSPIAVGGKRITCTAYHCHAEESANANESECSHLSSLKGSAIDKCICFCCGALLCSYSRIVECKQRRQRWNQLTISLVRHKRTELTRGVIAVLPLPFGCFVLLFIHN